jgi:hypothetical protein
VRRCAAGLDQRFQEAGGGARGQQHMAALGLDDAAVGRERRGARGRGRDLARDVEAEQPVAGEVEGESLRPRNGDAAEPGADGAGIGRDRPDQRGEALVAHGDRAAVLDPRAGRAEGWSKAMRPAMKAWLVVSAVVAISPATSTCAPPWKTMPEGFTSATPPLEVSRPAMAEGSGPVTRCSDQDPAPGWRISTWCPAPMSKPRHSITARLLDWVTCVRAGVCAICACPATTAPPCGRAEGACAAAMAGASRAVLASSRRRRRPIARILRGGGAQPPVKNPQMYARHGCIPRACRPPGRMP